LLILFFLSNLEIIKTFPNEGKHAGVIASCLRIRAAGSIKYYLFKDILNFIKLIWLTNIGWQFASESHCWANTISAHA